MAYNMNGCMYFVTANANAPAISVNNVSKSYRGSPILLDVSFEIPQYKIVGLFGLNGTGKTTVLKIILNLISKYDGEVNILLKSSRDVHSRDSLVFLPEKFVPNPHLLGEEFLNISNPVRDLKYTMNLLDEFGLGGDVIKQKIGTYSNGMAQKLGLVSALGTRRSIVILDEPTSGLDIVSRQAFEKVIKKMRDDFGCTILMTSHMLVDAENLCDYLVVLHGGSVAFSGPSSRFCESFETETACEAFNKIFTQAHE